MALQTLVTRSVNVFSPAVLTIGKIEAGTAANIIPETATMRGTLRAYEERVREQLKQDPALQGQTLFGLLCDRHPGRYQASQLRTLQRHIG